MKSETIILDIAKLVEAGEEDNALTILEAFQKETLFEYRKWYKNNVDNGVIIINPIFIDKFLES